MMSVNSQLATSLGRKDEVPNQILAKTIAEGNDTSAIIELVDVINGKDKALQSDAIKVLYEVGELNPALIVEQVDLFIALLSGKNNRLAWGAMTALDAIAAINPTGIYPHLSVILAAADAGSVITRDHAVGILVKLSQTAQYRNECFPLLMEQMQLKSRTPDLPKESQQKRIEKVLKKLAK